MTAWKDFERRVCAALGGRRSGPLGAAVSDCVGTPFAVECKRTSRPPCARWIAQARAQGKLEGKPWILVVGGHNDRRPIVILDLLTFAQLVEETGRLKKLEAIFHPGAEVSS